MATRKTLYLLRHPVTDSSQSLLPSAEETGMAGTVSLVLLEQAVASTPAFPGSIYVLSQDSNPSAGPESKNLISYRELVTLIAEYETTIVL